MGAEPSTTPAYCCILVSMPRQFDPAIPVSWDFYAARPTIFRFSADEPEHDHLDLRDRRDLFFFLLRATVSLDGPELDRLLSHRSFRQWEPHLPEATSLVVAIEREVEDASSAGSGYRHAITIKEDAYDDVLAVDDYYLAFNITGPQRMSWPLSDFVDRRMEAFSSGDNRDKRRVLEDVNDWADRWPGLRRQGLVRAVFPRAETHVTEHYNPTGDMLGLYSSSVMGLPCLHPKSHERLLRRRRGQRPDAARRAGIWGTYLIAWIVGTEALAVRLWNKSLVPLDYRWPSLSKYWRAKQRLLRDVKHILPPRGQQQPRDPLEQETADLLEWLIEARTRSRIRRLFAPLVQPASKSRG